MKASESSFRDTDEGLQGTSSLLKHAVIKLSSRRSERPRISLRRANVRGCLLAAETPSR